MTNELNQNWLQADSLLYVLNKDINCYEISVTQVAGSRDMNARAAFTTKLQNMLATHTAVDDATQRDAERYRYWRNKYSEKFGDADLTPENFDSVTDAQMLMASANKSESALTQPVVAKTQPVVAKTQAVEAMTGALHLLEAIQSNRKTRWHLDPAMDKLRAALASQATPAAQTEAV